LSLISSTCNINLVDIKVIDFGCSHLFKANEKYKEIIGTINYNSPEVIKGNYNEKCDIWSVGIIMYILLTGKMPFKGTSRNKIEKQILDKNFHCDGFLNLAKANVSAEGYDILTKLLCYDHEKRISAKEALNHPWFIKARKSEINTVSKHYQRSILNQLVQHKQEKNFPDGCNELYYT